ncbi:GNAT family N-acetyltransferase, partial [Undibacterium sp. SXout11W]|uniref:GNAT family N-acetyltransferase n=1 Tax=Undibacterium sp. SXout11W TaxID=3413050 RepID=UPI003BEF9AB1
SQLIYVAESSDRIVGFGAVSLIDGKIDAVFVDPDHAGSGIGRTVMQFLEEVAIESGSTATLHLEATLNAMPFYTKLGFAVDSPSLFISPRGFSLECIKMSKTLDDH